MSFRLSSIGLTTLGGLILLTGCSSTPVQAKAPAMADTPACRAASAKWPQTVSGLKKYATSSSSDAVRAWGKDNTNAIIARCGVSMPGPTTDACVSVNNIDWVQTQFDGGYQFTTYGRSPAIEVLIPTSVSSTPAMLLPAFTSAAAAIHQGSHHCD